MKRALLLVLPLLALVPMACRDNGGSLQIQGICAPTDDCVFPAECENFALGNPVLDPTALPTSYLSLILQLENQLPDNGDSDVKRLNTNDAHIDEAVIEYSGALGGKITMGASGTVLAESKGVAYIDLIPAAKALELPATPPAYPLSVAVLAKLRLRGYFDHGERFETPEYPITVEIAQGGVATCPDACPHPGQWPATCP